MPVSNIEGTSSGSFRIGSKNGYFITIVPNEIGYTIYDKDGNPITADISAILALIAELTSKLNKKLDISYSTWTSANGVIDARAFPIKDKPLQSKVYGISQGLNKLTISYEKNSYTNTIIFQTPLFETDYIELYSGKIYYNNGTIVDLATNYSNYSLTGSRLQCVYYSLIQGLYYSQAAGTISASYVHNFNDIYNSAVFSINGLYPMNGNIELTGLPATNIDHDIILKLTGAVVGNTTTNFENDEVTISTTVGLSDYGEI